MYVIERDYNWWNENVEHILKFYTDLEIYKSDPTKLLELKKIIAESKKRTSKKEIVPDDFYAIVDDEEN